MTSSSLFTVCCRATGHRCTTRSNSESSKYNPGPGTSCVTLCALSPSFLSADGLRRSRKHVPTFKFGLNQKRLPAYHTPATCRQPASKRAAKDKRSGREFTGSAIQHTHLILKSSERTAARSAEHRCNTHVAADEATTQHGAWLPSAASAAAGKFGCL